MGDARPFTRIGPQVAGRSALGPELWPPAYWFFCACGSVAGARQEVVTIGDLVLPAYLAPDRGMLADILKAP